MAKISVYLVWLVLSCCWAAMAEAGYMKYKDPKQHLNTRIKDLINRMTLEEKIGQMVQIDRTVASAEVMKKYYIGKYHLIILLCYLIKWENNIVPDVCPILWVGSKISDFGQGVY